MLGSLPLDVTFGSQQMENDISSLDCSSRFTDPLIIMEQKRQQHHNQHLLVHLNINSIANKIDEIKEINKTLKSSIIILTETKIDDSYTNCLFKLDDYRMFRKDRKKGGGGVMAYVKRGINVQRLKLEENYNTVEVLVLDVDIGENSSIVVGIYRPPSRSSNADYFLKLQKELHHLLTWVLQKRQTVIIKGDINLDKRKPNSREGRVLNDIEDVFDLKCLINEYTRITPDSKTLIDLILTNRPDLFDSTGVSDFGLSDHAMINGFLKPKVKKYRHKVITFRSKKNFVENNFKTEIHETMTNMKLQEIDSVDHQHNTWYQGINDVIDRHMPLKKMKVRERDVPYITTEWKKAIRRKRKAAKKHSKLHSKESQEEMKKWRNEATRLRRRAIKNYWKEKASDLKEERQSEVFLSNTIAICKQ